MTAHDRDEEDTTIYKVVVNHEEQYSIWPEYKENPAGWNDVGKAGLKAECLTYIKEVWTDMRPLSLRKKMEELANNPPPPPALAEDIEEGESLVERLSKGKHELAVSTRPEISLGLFKEAIDRGYVHIKFTETRGGTELGVRLDKARCDFSEADFEEGKGMAHLEGDLTLDYVKVKCITDIDLEKLAGRGHLIKTETEGQVSH
jgi:uncharacterized protein YbdZ (MbtH family)